MIYFVEKVNSHPVWLKQLSFPWKKKKTSPFISLLDVIILHHPITLAVPLPLLYFWHRYPYNHCERDKSNLTKAYRSGHSLRLI